MDCVSFYVIFCGKKRKTPNIPALFLDASVAAYNTYCVNSRKYSLPMGNSAMTCGLLVLYLTDGYVRNWQIGLVIILQDFGF